MSPDVRGDEARDAPLAVILGVAGPVLSPWERGFFRDADPFGFILFGRNIQTPDQVRRLTESLRDTVGRAAPILIDQEGGRVQRLGPPLWPNRPPAARFGALFARDPALGREAAWLNARAIGRDLARLGIDTDCLPVLDLLCDGAHDIVGDRAFSADPAVVADLGRAVMDGLVAEGVWPVIKHLPGHGRAHADSHFSLPVVDSPRALLDAFDFAPFRALADAPFGMTAHILFTDLDPDQPATLSPRVVNEVIRGHLGFDGLLMTDDVSMKALDGAMAERTRQSLAAGCDLVLHCNGDAAEMAEVVAAARPLDAAARRRWQRAQTIRAEATCARAGATDATAATADATAPDQAIAQRLADLLALVDAADV